MLNDGGASGGDLDLDRDCVDLSMDSVAFCLICFKFAIDFSFLFTVDCNTAAAVTVALPLPFLLLLLYLGKMS